MVSSAVSSLGVVPYPPAMRRFSAALNASVSSLGFDSLYALKLSVDSLLDRGIRAERCASAGVGRASAAAPAPKPARITSRLVRGTEGPEDDQPLTRREPSASIRAIWVEGSWTRPKFTVWTNWLHFQRTSTRVSSRFFSE